MIVKKCFHVRPSNKKHQLLVPARFLFYGRLDIFIYIFFLILTIQISNLTLENIKIGFNMYVYRMVFEILNMLNRPIKRKFQK